MADQVGNIRTNVHSYTEVATGLCYQFNGQWVDSSEVIDLLPDGSAAATNGEHQAFFPADIYSGAVEVVEADGKHFRSRPVALGYYDGSNNVLIAQLTNSVGVVTGQRTNQVVYSNAFAGSGIRADLLYTYRKGGFEQDVILQTQLPDPSSLGLTNQFLRLQVLTEFFDPPEPVVKEWILPAQAGLVLQDQRLDFGAMRMTTGRAFLLGSKAPQVFVAKQWGNVHGRQMLVEEVPLAALTNQMQTLPKPQALLNLRKGTHWLNLPPRRQVKADSIGKIKRVASASISRGFVVDYVTLGWGTTTDYTFQGDTTYFLSDYFGISGTTTIEGGTVLKFNCIWCADCPSVYMDGPVQCLTGPYSPAVLTAMDDDSVGTQIGGSSGSPSGNTYGNPAMLYIDIDAPNVTLQYIRCSYANMGIYFAGNSLDLRHSQFVNDYDAVQTISPISLENDLFFGIPDVAVQDSSSGSDGGVFLTFNQVGTAVSGLSTVINSLFVEVSDLSESFASYNCATNSPSATVFQVVGAASCYLANNTYQNAAGTDIDPMLLAQIQTMTTYPPLVYSGVSITADMTLIPQTQRDTNASALGYHYPVIDYVFGGVTVSNATLNVSPGTVIGAFGPQYLAINEVYSIGAAYGLCLGQNGGIICQGSATNTNYMVQYNVVQEQSTPNWETVTPGNVEYPYRLTSLAVNPGACPGLIYFRFTDWYVLELAQHYAGGSNCGCNISLQDCQFYDGTIYDDAASFCVTNSLFQRVWTFLDNQQGTPSHCFYNNLFWAGGLTVEASAAAFYDNLFDQCNSSYNSHATGGHNGYVNSSVIPGDSTGVPFSDSPAYQTGELGNYYYYPTNLSLIHEGSRTAVAAGLYYYTVTTNNAIEGTNTVSIGFHYPALGTNGLPLSPAAISVPPASQTNNPGDSVTFSVVATGTGPLSYQWAMNGTVIPNAISPQYTIFQISGTDAGTYTVTVSNAYGASTSAVLYVTPDIVTQPSVSVSSLAITGLAATGTPNLTFQWQSNGIAIADATNSTFTAVGSGHYTALVMNPVGTNVSAGVEIAMLQDIESAIANLGDQLVMTAPAGGTAYQWEWNGITLCNQTASSLIIDPADATNAGTYTVITTTGTNQTMTTTTLFTGPEVIVPPQDYITPINSNATFSVTAIGSSPFSYQWQFNGTNLAGATNSVLVVSNATQANVGSYTVALASQLEGNPYTVTSSYAFLGITAPIITTTVSNVLAEPGATVSFSNIVRGGAGFTYQWYKQVRTNAAGIWNYWPLAGGTGGNAPYVLAEVSGENTNVLTLSNVTNADSGVYKLWLYVPPAETLQAASQEINLYVDPAVTNQPRNQIVDVGTANVTFTVGVWSTNSTSNTYQWMSNGVVMSNGVGIAGATGASLTLSNVRTNYAASYSVVVSNSYVGSAVTSSPFDGILYVRTPIWLTTNTSHSNLVSNFNFATTNGGTNYWYCVSNADYFTTILTGAIPHIVHYDAGVFQTRGSEEGIPNTAQAGWQHWGNTNTNGITIIQLLCNSNAEGNVIFAASDPMRVDGFELHDLTLDCNGNGQTNLLLPTGDNVVCWAAVYAAGNNVLISNVTFIHFGQQGDVEDFPLFLAPSAALDENSHMITLYSNMTVSNCLFTTPATNNGPGGGLTTATILPGWQYDQTIFYITNSGFFNCVVSNVSSDFGWSHGFTAISIQNCVVDGCQAAVYWEVPNPIYYGQDALIQSNSFTNVNFGFQLYYNGAPANPTAVGNITLISNVIATTNGIGNWAAAVDINGYPEADPPYALPQIPSLTAQFNRIITGGGVGQWGFYLWNISNALVSDNSVDNLYYGLTVDNGEYARMPLSFLAANHNTDDGQLIQITPWANVSNAPVIGTQQKGDFFLNGKADLLWRNTSTGQNVLWPMTGTNFEGCSNGLPSMATNWVISGTADFTGDCNNDILWTRPGTTNVLLWVMKGPSFITSNWLPALPDPSYGIAATGDFNGDGKTDLILTNSTNNQFTIWLMNGTNFLTNVVISKPWPSTNSQIVGTGEFNGDGQTDILWRDYSTGNNYVWDMSGTNIPYVGKVTTLSAETDTNWQIVGVGDFNGDGIADIVWRDPTTGSNRIWLMSDPLGINETSVSLPSLQSANWTMCCPK